MVVAERSTGDHQGVVDVRLYPCADMPLVVKFMFGASNLPHRAAQGERGLGSRREREHGVRRPRRVQECDCRSRSKVGQPGSAEEWRGLTSVVALVLYACPLHDGDYEHDQSDASGCGRRAQRAAMRWARERHGALNQHRLTGPRTEDQGLDKV